MSLEVIETRRTARRFDPDQPSALADLLERLLGAGDGWPLRR